MKHKLCLHGLDVKNRAQLYKIVQRLLPDATIKYKLKEKYFNDNDMYKCRVAMFNLPRQREWRISCYWGVMMASDIELPIADIIIEFENDKPSVQGEVNNILERLLSCKNKFVVEEPNFSERLDQLRGCYELRETSAYDTHDARCALACHLPWQIYGVSKQWGQIDERGAERMLLRQLRVKLRRLRSSLALLKPLLPEQVAAHWQSMLKARTNSLSTVREYDVALQTCMKLEMGQDSEEEVLPLLRYFLGKLRDKEAARATANLKLNAMTLQLSKLLVALYLAPPLEEEMRLEAFFCYRFSTWYDKLQALPEKYHDLHNMEEMHKVRIKIKRFRYALQCVPELAAAPALLRSLKYLQDSLGAMHDAYINKQILAALLEENHANAPLGLEVARFEGWDKAKADVALEQLPRQWEDFNLLLSEWSDEYL